MSREEGGELGRKSEYRLNKASGRRRSRHLVPAVIWACLVVMILLASNAVAAPTGTGKATVKYVPPYSGSAFTTQVYVHSGCDVSGAKLVHPVFNLTTGRALDSTQATAVTCGSANSSADISVGAGFDSTSFTSLAGLYGFVAHWSLTFSVILAATPGSASQAAEAHYYVVGWLGVEDLTNHTIVYGSWVTGYAISSGTFSQSYSNLHASVYLNTTLVTSDVYELVIYITTESAASASTGPGAGYAIASVNMGSGGEHAVLTSVTRS